MTQKHKTIEEKIEKKLNHIANLYYQIGVHDPSRGEVGIGGAYVKSFKSLIDDIVDEVIGKDDSFDTKQAEKAKRKDWDRMGHRNGVRMYQRLRYEEMKKPTSSEK